jgi:oligoendopeptidase F
MILAEQEVTEHVYHNLLDVIFQEIAPCMRRYVELRRRVLGLERILYCDIEAPLDPGYNPKITYKAACEVILDGLSVLGPEYMNVVREAIDNRWVDLADNKGKWTGASCNNVAGVHPYIRITWNDSMHATLLLAHELGHAVSNVMSQRNRRFTNTRTSRFFMEAPSTINELLVGYHILNHSTDSRQRRWAIMQLLAIYNRNFVNHLIEGELQRRTYALAEMGQPLTEQILSRVQGEILEEFWSNVVEVDMGARLTWMRQAHYYKGLYSYTYSAGLTIGSAVIDAIQEQGQPAVQQWLEVLEVGSSKKPLELARMCGVDITKPEPIRRALKSVDSLVDEVANSF